MAKRAFLVKGNSEGCGKSTERTTYQQKIPQPLTPRPLAPDWIVPKLRDTRHGFPPQFQLGTRGNATLAKEI